MLMSDFAKQMSRGAMGAFFAMGAIGAALAQNSFPTPGGATVPGYVNMCITGNLAAPCNPSGGGGGYVGPGDVVAWRYYVGLRAYSGATTGANLVQACNAGDAACVNLVSDTTGNIVVPTIGGTDCSVATCTIKIFYDLTGNGNTFNPLNANRATLSANCVGTKWCAAWGPAGTACYVGPAGWLQAQPFTMAFVAKRAASGAYTAVLSDTVDTEFGYSPTAGQAYVQPSGGLLTTMTGATEGAFHSVTALVNSVVGHAVVVDGTSSTPSPGGSANSTSGTAIIGAFGNAGTPCQGEFIVNGNFLEAGVAAGALSAGNVALLNSNQHTYWGF